MNRLAINNGAPVREDKLAYHVPDIESDEKNGINSAIDRNDIGSGGPQTKNVEAYFEDELNAARCLAVKSGTHALELALITADYSSGAEVIVPAYTYTATPLAVVQAGYTPVFADVDPNTGTMRVSDVKKVVNGNTQCITLVHYGGYPAPQTQSIADYCSQHGIDLLEDAAQTVGAQSNGKPTGTIGRFGAYSFHETKNITCGEGGLVVLNKQQDRKRGEMVYAHGTNRLAFNRNDVSEYTWHTRGSNYSLSNLHSAFLMSQLKRSEAINNKRRAIQKNIRSGIRDIVHKNGGRVLDPAAGDTENGHITAFLLPDAMDQQWVVKALNAEGVDARSHYPPLNQSPYAVQNNLTQRYCPNAQAFSRRIIRLPTHTEMEQPDVHDVTTAVKKVFNASISKDDYS